MTAKPFMREIYTRAVGAKNVKPSEAELDEWTEVLKDFTYSDVDAAVRRWANDLTVEEFTQRPRGARMPKAAELKLSIVQFNKAQNRPKGKFGGCEKCGHSGWVAVSLSDKRVRRCGCFYKWASERTAVSA